MCRRSGSIGRSTFASLATCAAPGPAALITVRAAISSLFVRTPATPPVVGDIAVLGDEKEVADLMKVRVGPDLVGETLDMRERALRELDVDLARELKTNAAGILARRSGSEPIAFDNEDIAHTLLREVVRDG